MDWSDMGEAALNAVVGDYLDARGNALAIDMALYHRGQPVESWTVGQSKICVLVHGMACTEACWAFPEEPELDYGALLEQTHGYTPLYVRYNTGLPIWKNGEKLSALLESVVQQAFVPLEEITLIGHSLGGLVIRSACHQGRSKTWLPLVRRAFYLASPHRGSPLEKAGRVATSVMKQINDPVVQLIADVANVRSAAIKDLGCGDIAPDEQDVPLHEGMEHYLVAGSLPGPLAAVLGDGLVRAPSATHGRCEDIGHFSGLHHMAIAHHRDVFEWIAQRCGPQVPHVKVAHEPELGAKAERVSASVELLTDAVGRGASAVQEVHEAIASRPYDVLEHVPELAKPTRVVRAVHFGILRGSYKAVRVVNELVGAAVSTKRSE